MRGKKTIEVQYRLRNLKPDGRVPIATPGSEKLVAAEYRVRNALAGNEAAMEVFFDTLARQAKAGASIFGPFLFVGKTGTGKTTMVNALGKGVDPNLFVTFGLGTCRSAHEKSSLFGSPAGYQGCENKPDFVSNLERLNETMRAFRGQPSDLPWPVLCFENADEAHPEVLASLTDLLIKGVFTPSNFPEVRLERCIVILTMSRPGDEVEKFKDLSRAKAEAELKRVLGNLKGAGGSLLKPKLLEEAHIVPFREASPSELTSFIATEVGRDMALWLDLEDSRTGRVRYSPSNTEELWEAANQTIQVTATARHLIEALRSQWQQLGGRALAHVEEASAKITVPPPAGQVYELSWGTIQRSEDPEWPYHYGGFDLEDLTKTHTIRVELPLPYLQRHLGANAVVRGDYWELPDDFERKLNLVISGQTALIRTLTEKMRARLNETGAKPMLSFIVIGPTGTGKTALGQAIAEVSGQPLVSCACNTWQTREAVLDGIFGPDPTSVASRLKENPASVIVFDEVDKANQKFWDLFMNVGDTGQIVESETGRIVSLRHAVVELTSNYMADQLEGLADLAREKSGEELDPLIRKALTNCAAINPACLERLDLAGLMMQLTGEDAYPMWAKFAAEKLNAMARPLLVAPEVPAYLENRHADLGGGAGARARERACARMLEKWGLGGTEDFETADGVLGLSPAALAWMAANPAPRSERQRYWRVTPEKVARLKSLYKGNDELLDALLGLLRVEGMKTRPRGPVAVIFAVGPTGSGKSFLGKALAEAFGKDKAVEIKCGQCKDEHVVSPFLFSAPAGYEGAELGGQLTTPMLTRKDRVVIFDEIEKAHPSMLDQLLNVLDEGCATDLGKQLPVDLKQCLILLTSNLAADELQAEMTRLDGRPFAEKEAAARRILEATGAISPEKLARFQRVYPVTYASAGSGDDADVAAALQSVLGEFSLEGLRVHPSVLRALGRECRAPGPRDVRAFRSIIQARLASVLIGSADGVYTVTDGELRLADGSAEPSSPVSNPPPASDNSLSSE